MSVTSETYKVSYPGRGDTGPYPITFDVVLNDGGDATDIVVKLLDTDGVETDITSVCTVTGMNVYTTASYSADYDVVLIRYPSLTQPYTFPYVTKFPSRTFEAALDRLLFLVQRLALGTDQSFKVPLSEPEPAREPSIVDRANKWRAFDSDGDPIATAGAAGEYPVSDFMATVLDDEDAAAGRTTLDVYSKAQNDAHAALAAAGTHGSTVAATANKLIHRDASGRAQVASPSAAADIARKDTPAVGVIETGASVTLKCKVIEIGDWDMDTDLIVYVNHGLADRWKIRSVRVTIRPDSDATNQYLYTLERDADGYVSYVSATEIGLARIATGHFDSTDFNETTYNRGWVTVWYEE